MIKTQRLLIKEACQSKGITIKRLCDDLNLSYNAFKANIRTQYLGRKNVKRISEYLDLDLVELMNAPLDNPKYESDGN